MNLGAKLVQERIRLNIQWMHIHRWLYEQGTPIIKDFVYDVRYEPYAVSEGVVGTPQECPALPQYACGPEEARWSGLPEWDHMAEFRKSTQKDNK